MRTTIILLALALLGGGFLAGCGGDESTANAAECICEKGKAGDTVWCEKCEVGYVGSSKTGCRDCYGAKQGGPACEACAEKTAACVCSEGKAGGTVWCEKCGSGYVAGTKTKCLGCVTANLDGNECEACASK